MGLLITTTALAQTSANQRSADNDTPTTAPSLADAYDLFTTGEYDKARSMYAVLAQNPKQVLQARLGQVRCDLQTGQYESVGKALTSLNGSSSFEWHLLKSEYLEIIGEYSSALEHAQEAVELKKRRARPRLRVAQLLETLGRRDDAIIAYKWFDRQLVEREELPRDAEWMTHAAIGFVRYSVLTRTNVAQRTKHALKQMLQTAYERIDRSYWPARIAAADLLRERYNNDEEDGSISDYQAALRINNQLPEAFVGMGEIMLSRWNFEEVERFADKALEVNPHYAPAFHLLGKKLLVERRYHQAFKAVEPALQINRNDLIAIAIQGASKACQFDDTGLSKFTTKAKAVHPAPAQYFKIVADALAGIRQYPDSERAYLEAIEFEPTDANARTELGMMYMQWGLEDKARDTLESAWALDPFNERTLFTMELFQSLSKFDQVETDHFLVKYDASNDPGLGELAAEYLESVYDLVTADYETPIDGKTIIEFFPTHRAFGVRITGKPWIHTVGAATGRVIALASPNDSAHVDPYNMARVLLHEFTHTVTLEATRNRIPHWFTEGLAVLQEEAPRSFEWAQALSHAARTSQLFTLESIDWGFMRPRKRGDRQLAYAQSEWMCEYLVERYGFDAINKLLRNYFDGKTQSQAFAKVLKISTKEFDADFADWGQRQAASWGFDQSPPEDVKDLKKRIDLDESDASLWGRLAQAQMLAGAPDKAMESARKALDLNKNEIVALTIFVTLIDSLVQKEPDRTARQSMDEHAIDALERLLKVDPKSWIAPRYRAAIALRQRDYDRAFELYQRLQRVCPIDPASWKGLAGIHLIRDKPQQALPQLLELVRLVPNDAEAFSQIAQISRSMGRLRDAKYWLRQARYVAPFNVTYLKQLGDTHMQDGDTASALDAYETLAKIEPNVASHFEAAALAAHKLGRTEQAQDHARRAVKLNPDSPVGSLLP